MKLPYGNVLVDEEVVVHEEKADIVRSIFEYYLAGASLGQHRTKRSRVSGNMVKWEYG